jgi:hypothetical protein
MESVLIRVDPSRSESIRVDPCRYESMRVQDRKISTTTNLEDQFKVVKNVLLKMFGQMYRGKLFHQLIDLRPSCHATRFECAQSLPD